MCNYTSGTLECRGDGYLWDADQDGFDPEDITYPCPSCNTKTFLLDAKEQAETTSYYCNPTGSGSGVTIWERAVQTAKAVNCDIANEVLMSLGTIEALYEDDNETALKSKRFNYSSPQESKIHSKQRGSTLVVALVLLTIISLVATYAMEGAVLQTRLMTVSKLGHLTFQECKNEQIAGFRYFNVNNGAQSSHLLAITRQEPTFNSTTNQLESPALVYEALTKQRHETVKSEFDSITWQYLRKEPSANEGFNIDTERMQQTYLFETNCVARFITSTSRQYSGAHIRGLEQVGIVN